MDFLISTAYAQAAGAPQGNAWMQMLPLVAIFVVRFGLRGFMADHASYLHVSAAAITDVFLLLAVGLVCIQRLEIALRASRLLTEARAARRDLSA